MIKYIPNFVPTKILIVGAGGTGSRIVPLLGQFLKTCAWILNPEITLIDDDVVEEKNLLRQNFIAPDVGKPKAEVLAQRYSRAFNIPITPLVMRVTKTPDPYAARDRNPTHDPNEAVLAEVFTKHATNSIVILCVDSPEARRHIVGRLIQYQYGMGTQTGPNVLLLDSGNENDFGQVSLSTMAIPTSSPYSTPMNMVEKLPNGLPVDVTIPLIPMDLSYFRDMVATTTASCADLDQTMAINCMMANVMFSLIQSFYYCKPFTAHRYNVTLTGGIMPENITPRFLAKTALLRTAEVEHFGARTNGIKAVDITKQADELSQANRNLEALKRNAEQEQIAKDHKEKVTSEDKLRKMAVEEAMRKYGWKLPEEISKEVVGSAKPAKKAARSKSNDYGDILEGPVSKWDTDVVFEQLMELVDQVK